MKQISEKLRQRLKDEPASAELVLALLNETSPEEYCTINYYQGNRNNPDKCCILGRIGYEVDKDPLMSDKAEEYRFITGGERMPSVNLAGTNNGDHRKYQQETPYERVKAAMEDLVESKKAK